MKRSTTLTLISASALLIAGGMALNLSVGRRQPAVPSTEPAQAPRSEQGNSEPVPAAAPPSSGHYPPPHTLAATFGWTVPSAPKSPPPPVKDPAVDAQWIRYLGAITGADGITYRYFKNERTGEVIRTADGKTVDGWTLQNEGNGHAVLEHDGQTMRVGLTE